MSAIPVAAQAPAPTTTAFDGTYVGVSRSFEGNMSATSAAPRGCVYGQPGLLTIADGVVAVCGRHRRRVRECARRAGPAHTKRPTTRRPDRRTRYRHRPISPAAAATTWSGRRRASEPAQIGPNRLGKSSSVSLGTARSDQFVVISAIGGALALRLRCTEWRRRLTSR
jgi:hypothetical protein